MFCSQLGAVPSSTCPSSSLASNSRSIHHACLVIKFKSSVASKNPRCSVTRVQQLSVSEKEKQQGDAAAADDDDDKSISKIQVPRQSYIPVSKTQLLDAILFRMFDSPDDAHQFLLLSSCLDSILHAEHKTTLEEMRADYFHSNETEGTVTDGKQTMANGNREDSSESSGRYNLLELGNPLPTNTVVRQYSSSDTSLAAANRFQRAFVQLLYDAQFEELSAMDLTLTSSLNTDYLLTLPIYVDWKRAAESNAIIFRRGYTTEKQKGLLLVEKLDFIQSKLLRGVFFFMSKPVASVAKWTNESLRSVSQIQQVQDWIKKIKPSLEELKLFRKTYFDNEEISDSLHGVDRLSDNELPIWLAAERAVSRYEGFLSPVGPRERLFRKLLTWTGFAAPAPEMTYEIDSEISVSEPHLRPTVLSRISLSDIWRPAAKKYCDNSPWKMLKTSISILFSRSLLQEPAFQELILLYNKDVREREHSDKGVLPSLQLKIYERIPIPDLPVIFPHKKLSFRIIDTVRLDVATIVGLLAYFINYKFEDVVSSPSAVLLDVVAITALILFVTRVALGYKQTWDRYQLLVNKTLYEKTLASGFGSVHFLLDASEQQQYKEAILIYAVLLKMTSGQEKSSQVTFELQVGDECERFIYDAFKVKVKMPVDKAMSTLLRLGLVIQTTSMEDDSIKHQPIPCSKAYKVLKQRWNNLLN